MTKSSKYWFPAKRYGWGWGLPTSWQGWCVLVLFFVLVFAGVALFPPAQNLFAFLLYMIGITGGLVAVCYAKGEPPKWRWGDK